MVYYKDNYKFVAGKVITLTGEKNAAIIAALLTALADIETIDYYFVPMRMNNRKF